MAWVLTAARYLVSLKPLGIDFHHETEASSPREAVGHALYYYYGKSRMKLQERLLRFRQEFGEEGWESKVSEMADEVTWTDAPEKPAPPEPQPKPAAEAGDEQLKLFEFQKDTNKEHPAAQIAGEWKRTHTMKFVDFDKLKDILQEEEATISIKLDGELVALHYENGKVEVVTAKGTVRTSMPPTDEAASLLKEFRSATFLAELYVVNEEGKPQSYMKSSSILKSPDKGMDHLIRLSVFDIAVIDGREYETETIEDNAKEIERIFGKGKIVHAAKTVHGGMSTAQELWDELPERGWEGLVVYFGDKIYKVKPILSLDMVVVAVSKSKKIIDRVGAMLTAFMDKEGLFRLNGEVGGGLTDEDRAMLMEWAQRNKVAEDEEHIWVDPFKEPLIVEVEALEVNTQKMPKLDFKDKKWVTIEEDWGGTLRFPQFVRYRDDKEPKHPDVRVEQLPISAAELSNELREGRNIRTINGHEGRIMELVPRSGDSGFDFDLIIRWNSPLWGSVEISEVHPTEVVIVWD